MKFRVFGTAVVEGDVEAPTPDIAWERFRQHVIGLREPFSKNVDDFKVAEVETDEIEELEDVSDDNTDE